MKIVHRDIKPTNILFSKEGVVKLSEFAVAGDSVGAMGDTFMGSLVYTAVSHPPFLYFYFYFLAIDSRAHYSLNSQSVFPETATPSVWTSGQWESASLSSRTTNALSLPLYTRSACSYGSGTGRYVISSPVEPLGFLCLMAIASALKRRRGRNMERRYERFL